MSQLRDEAEVFARALEIGVCDVAEVIAWSDAQLLRDELPFAVLCEVSLAHDRYPLDVAGLLRQLPGAPASPRVGRLIASMIAAKMLSDPSRAYQIAAGLFELYLVDEVEPPRLKKIAGWAWDALDLAEAGHIEETRKQVIDQMSAVLHDAALGADAAWSVGVGSSDAA